MYWFFTHYWNELITIFVIYYIQEVNIHLVYNNRVQYRYNKFVGFIQLHCFLCRQSEEVFRLLSGLVCYLFWPHTCFYYVHLVLVGHLFRSFIKLESIPGGHYLPYDAVDGKQNNIGTLLPEQNETRCSDVSPGWSINTALDGYKLTRRYFAVSWGSTRRTCGLS